MNGTHEQRGRFQENKNEKDTYAQNREEAVETLVTDNKERMLGEFDHHKRNGDKRVREKSE